MSTPEVSKSASRQLQVEVTVGRLSFSAPGFLWGILVLVFMWAIAATYVALSDAAVAIISNATLLRAAAILGAFVLFASLVGATERLRWRERRLDAEFERGRHRTAEHTPD